jgi:hypothetical protein
MEVATIRLMLTRTAWVLVLSFVLINACLYRSSFDNKTLATNLLTIALVVNFLLLVAYTTFGTSHRRIRISVLVALMGYFAWALFRVLLFFFGSEA